MPKALIVSLGGTPEPIIKSIETHQPDRLYFFSSQESNSKEYPSVKKKLDEAGLNPKIESVIVDDVNDLVHCYEKALEIASRIETRGVSTEDVVVDYTGGTKNMTAALVLATVTKGYRFSYVGGKERTKDGLGIVVSGSEEVKESLSPWQVLLVEDRKKMALFFNSYQFSAAKELARKLSTILDGMDKAIHESLSDMIEGYRLWDSFSHDDTLKVLSKAVPKLLEYSQLKKDGVLSEFIESARANLSFLGEMKNKPAERSVLIVFDLIHNAKRRAEEGKFDDAVARLYRSLEMIGQIEFEKEFKCPTSNAKAERLPGALRDEIIRKHTATDGKIKIPLYDTFRVLNEIDNTCGQLFIECESEIMKVLNMRNSSILAHGQTPISKESFDKLLSIVEDFIRHSEPYYKMEFPKLRWG